MLFIQGHLIRKFKQNTSNVVFCFLGLFQLSPFKGIFMLANTGCSAQILAKLKGQKIYAS